MSYGDRIAVPTGWLVFGWLSILWLPLIAIPSGLICAFTLAFCDAPGSCQNADIYVPAVLFSIPAFWIVPLITLIRKRFSVMLRISAMLLNLVVAMPCLWFAWIMATHPA